MSAPTRVESPRRRTLLRAFAQGTLIAGPLLAFRFWSAPTAASEAAGTVPQDAAANQEGAEPTPDVAVISDADEPVEGPAVPIAEAELAPVAATPPAPFAAPPPIATTEPRRITSSLLRPRPTTTLPIVMYHHVDDLPRSIVDPYRRDLTAPTLQFKLQLDLLERYGVKTVSLADLASHFAGAEPLPERAVVLTFDDGYDDNFRLAYPLLRQYGMTATFFIITDLVGQPGYLTWDQIRDMQRHGMAIESHTVTHPDLSILPPRELRRQLLESRLTLERELDRVVRFIAYPSGKYSPLVISEARAAGYEAAVTVNYGLMQRSVAPFELVRVRVKGADTLDSMAAKMVPSHWAYTHSRFGA